MRFYKAGLAAVASIVALLAANPAAASTSSFSELSVTYQLYDMDPLDGVTASIQFGDLSDYANYAYVYTDSPTQAHWSDSAGDVSQSLDLAHVKAASSASSNGSLGFDLFASGFAANPASDSEGNLLGSAYNSFDSIAAATREFTLSAHTLVVFSGISRIGATVTAGGYEDALVYATLNVEGYSQDGAQGQSSYDANYLDEKTYAAPSQIKDRTLGVWFINLTGMNAAGSVHAAVEAQGFTNVVTAVPEPETYAMLLAGLGLIGAAARRRQKI